MHPNMKRIAGLVTTALLVVSLTPAVASAGAPGRRPSPATSQASAVTAAISGGLATVAPDAYDPSDDTTAGARDLTTKVTGFGAAPYEELHALSAAAGTGGSAGDEDWVKFRVASADVTEGNPYVLEAHTSAFFTSPVIEVYGPVAAGGPVGAADPRTLDGVTDPAATIASLNGPWFLDGHGASISFLPAASGYYYARVRPFYSSFTQFGDMAGAYTLRLKIGDLTRLSGPTRLDTAIRISQERYPRDSVDQGGGKAVVVASGYGFPDALAGSVLAGAVNGPVLLTAKSSLSANVSAEIVRIGAKRVFLLGSSSAVSTSVADALAAVPGVTSVKRLSAGTRVGTAAEIASQTAVEAITAPIAFVVDGYSFPDALSAAPVASYNSAPILLTHPSTLDTETSAMMEQLGILDVVIVGSSSAVSTSVADALAADFGPTHVFRVGGASRYETSKLMAEWSTSLGESVWAGQLSTITPLPEFLRALDWRGMGIASGENFPDAVGGGPFCGMSGHPMLLTKPATLSPWIYDVHSDLGTKTSYLADLSAHGGKAVGRSYVFGSPIAVSGGVAKLIDQLIGAPSGLE